MQAQITEAWIQKARVHCKMSPARLAELRVEPHTRHWQRLLARRAARLSYYNEHGKAPPSWQPLLPGERDRLNQLAGFAQYWKGGLAALKAQVRKHPEKFNAKLSNLSVMTKQLKSKHRKMAAIDHLLAHTILESKLKAGTLSLREYQDFMTQMPSSPLQPKSK